MLKYKYVCVKCGTPWEDSIAALLAFYENTETCCVMNNLVKVNDDTEKIINKEKIWRK